MGVVRIVRGADSVIDVKFQGQGATLENHAIALLDVSPELTDKVTAAFEGYTPAAGQVPDESVIRVKIDGKVPIPTGAASFRVQATPPDDAFGSVAHRVVVQVV